jgi:hypothetical protein
MLKCNMNKLLILVNGKVPLFWRNFVKKVNQPDTSFVTFISKRDELLLEYNAKYHQDNQFPYSGYLIFESEEAMVFFVLKFS